MSRTFNVAQPTVINTELRPLDESFYIKANGQLEQWFYDNTSQYAPDRRIISLILTPELSVFDADTQSSYSTAVADTEDPEHLSFFVMQWFATEYNSTMSVTYAYAISASADTADSQTAPADVSSWSSTVVATTTAMPYAWVREVRTATVNGTSKTVTRYFCNTSGLTYTNTSGGGYWEEEITNITNSQTADYVISDNTLIVKKNVVYSHGVTIRCIATYIDPRDSGVTYTVQDTVTLTTNRDATVIYPEVAIASPSARTFNPLTDWKNVGGVDTQDSEFEFDGVVLNHPDVEQVISEDLAQYKVDGWGTEEIESASGSCSPTLTIRYPDGSIETDARFMYRKTADGTKLDMGGEVISWNQLVSNGDFSNGTTGWGAVNSTISASNSVLTIKRTKSASGLATRPLSGIVTSHKYYMSCFAKTSSVSLTVYFGFCASNGAISNNTNVTTASTSYTKLCQIVSPKNATDMLNIRYGQTSAADDNSAMIYNVMCIDLTTIYGSGKEPTSVAQFESDYQMWFGKQLTYEPYDAGSQRQTFAPSSAFITNLKGETVAWNQLLENGNFADTSGWSAIGSSASLSVSNNVATITKNSNAMNIGGVLYKRIANLNTSHKYYLSCIARTLADTHTLTIGFYNINGTEGGNTLNSTNSTSYTKLSSIVSPKSNANVFALRCGMSSSATGVQANVYSCMCIDLTLIYGVGNEPTTTDAFEADYLKWFGKPLTYETYDAGSLKPVKMLSMKTVGFNAADYDEMKVGSDNYVYNYNGYYCKSFKLLPNTTYRIRKKASSYGSVVLLINSDSAINSGNYYDTRSPSSYSKDYTTNSSGLLYVGVVSGTSARVKARLEEIDLQIYLINDDSRNGHYESHWHNKSMLNVTEIKGRVVTNGEPTGNPVTIFPDGLLRERSVWDEIYVENGKVYAIKRVGNLDLGNAAWRYNANYNAFYRTISSVVTGKNYIPFVCSRYSRATSIGQNSVGEKQYGVSTTGGRSWSEIYIKDSTYSDTDIFKTAMSGVMVYYELATPITYEIDEIQSPFIFKWFGINSSGQEVDATMMPWYKEGQDTSKLKVDAMYGENINVVLRCTKGAGLNELSPSKAYASLSWRVPEIDCHVVSQNGQAVRTSTGSMTFGTTINVNGEVLSDNRRDAHLRFNWKYRTSTSTTENDAGWGTTKEIANSNLIHVKSAVNATLASTIVYPKVYLLGAWKPATSTTTDYDKPTTTKDGVNYERTID